ncbi:unnamed protein product [Cunninghamella echinulata]
MGFRKGAQWKKKGDKAKSEKVGRNETGYKETEQEMKFSKNTTNQNILPEEEFDNFYEYLKKPLPSTFRITGTRSNALQIRKYIKEHYVTNMQNIVVDDIKYDPPTPLPWYPDELGWQITCPRSVLRNSKEYAAFQKFIVAENETGNICRQEAVSMVPPLLMDIKPHQWVLDMCAAPGSKTSQIVEAIHANDKHKELPYGLVVANDADYKRSQLLVHQLKRLQSPCFMATNHDGSQFPNITISENGVETPWQFDRVLCDVPCSGDGTLRKNQKIWKEWSQGAALSLHPIQVQIFLRGAQLTKMGGRIVYSTCSFNPIENEAVVAEVLRLADGALKLLDVSDQLPELIRRPGLKNWKVMTRDNKYITSIDQIDSHRTRRKFPKSAFPPENPDELNLERCLRIYPQDQNTGGFFVAVFEKVKPMTAADRMSIAKEQGKPLSHAEIENAQAKDETLVKSINEEISTPPSTTEQESTIDDENNNDTSSVPSKRNSDNTNAEPSNANKKVKKDVNQIKEAPFDMMAVDNPDLLEIKSFYGLDPKFPMNQFLLRSELNTRNRNIYFVSEAVKSVLGSKQFNRLHVVNTGVRLFSRQGSLANSTECAFRISAEGVPLLQQYIEDRRVLKVTVEDLKVILVKAFPMIAEFTEDTKTKLEKLPPGGLIFVIDMTGTSLQSDSQLNLPVWRGKASLNILLNKHDKKSLCQRLFDLTPEPIPGHIKDLVAAGQNADKNTSTSTDEASEITE